MSVVKHNFLIILFIFIGCLQSVSFDSNCSILRRPLNNGADTNSVSVSLSSSSSSPTTQTPAAVVSSPSKSDDVTVDFKTVRVTKLSCLT